MRSFAREPPAIASGQTMQERRVAASRAKADAPSPALYPRLRLADMPLPPITPHQSGPTTPCQPGLPVAQRQTEEPGAGTSRVRLLLADAGGAAYGKVRAVDPSHAKRRPNRTGLPDRLKAGVEMLSGMALDDVRVRYRSPEPARIGALAFARGRDIHLAAGQEHNLPHEAWHVVQQARGRVKPTVWTNGVAVNDDRALEREADLSGSEALRDVAASNRLTAMKTMPFSSMSGTVQMQSSWWDKIKKHPFHAVGGSSVGAIAGATVGSLAGPVGTVAGGLVGAMLGGALGGWVGSKRSKRQAMSDMWKNVDGDEAEVKRVVKKEPLLQAAYADITDNIDKMRFRHVPGKEPAADPSPGQDGRYDILFGRQDEQPGHYKDPHLFRSAMLHEMMHVTAGSMYGSNQRHPEGTPAHFATMALKDVPDSAMSNATHKEELDDKGYDKETGLHDTHFSQNDPKSARSQANTMIDNWEDLETKSKEDLRSDKIDNKMFEYIKNRISYAESPPNHITHYDTVLIDMTYYMNATDNTNNESYKYLKRMLADANKRRSKKTKDPVARI